MFYAWFVNRFYFLSLKLVNYFHFKILGLLALGSYHAILREEHPKKTGIPLSEAEKQLIAARKEHLKLAHVLVESCVALYTEMVCYSVVYPRNWLLYSFMT